jgi:hypothetical protein
MYIKILVASVFSLLMVSCASNPNSSQAMQCNSGLDSAYKELNLAKANGFDGTVNYTKAASLLTAAKVQQQFGKYPNCIDKIKRAREFMRASKR